MRSTLNLPELEITRNWIKQGPPLGAILFADTPSHGSGSGLGFGSLDLMLIQRSGLMRRVKINKQNKRKRVGGGRLWLAGVWPEIGRRRARAPLTATFGTRVPGDWER